MTGATCAFVDCRDAASCCLEGGCTLITHPGQQPREQLSMRASAKEAEGLKKNAPALNGTKPREVRDPVTTPRKRKAITP